MIIQVNDFQWEPGKNDAGYIKLLESSRDEWQKIAQKAIAKLKALSKAQEPVKPNAIMHGKMVMYYQCPSCIATIDPSDNFCRRCGRAVKWE